jgi:gliding motility-associated-like protein
LVNLNKQGVQTILIFLVLLHLNIFFAFAQCDTSRWVGKIDPGAGGAITNVLDAQTIFQGGVLTAAPSPSFPNPYYVNFFLKDTFCITSNFAIEVRLKNDPSTGGAPAGDTWLTLTGSGIIAGCLLEGDPAAQQYTAIYAGSIFATNQPQLVMNLSEWRLIRLDFIDNIVNFSYDGSNFFSLPYTGDICNINNLNVGFREAGQVDYIKIYDAYNDIIYYEEFTDCNTLSLAPDCIAPEVSALSTYSSYCQGDSIYLSGGANVPIQFQWNGPNNFVSTVANPVISNALPVNQGWYKLTGYVNPCTPVSKDSIFITVNPKKITSVFPKICDGDSYVAGGQSQTVAGVYYDTLTTAAGCDSIIITNLSILSSSTTSLPKAICLGDSILAGGSFQKTAGIYNDTLINVAGCDSVIITNLTVISPLYTNVNAIICQGSSYFAGGANQWLPGTYYDTLQSSIGCDSIVITQLQVTNPSQSSQSILICSGDSIFIGGGFQKLPGIYIDTLQTSAGCDSIVTTDLGLIYPVYGVRNISICQGDSFFTGGSFQSQAGIYIDTIQSVAGCDSILTTTLSLIAPVLTDLSVSICEGDSFFVGGYFQTLPGIYRDTLSSNLGCDSIIATTLQLIFPLLSSVSINICEGDSLFVGGKFQTTAGIYLDTLQSSAGCDSIVTTDLQFISPVYENIDAAICNGDQYFAGGALQTTAGTYQDTLQSLLGCDSIITTHLQIIFPVYGNKQVTICDGQSYLAGGSQQISSGIYYDTLTSSQGCDSILITDLVVLPNPYVYVGNDTSICTGSVLSLDAGFGFSSYLWNTGSTSSAIDVNETGSYWVAVTDQSGCTGTDSITLLKVLPNPAGFLPKDTFICGKISKYITVPGFSAYLWSNGSQANSILITDPGKYSLIVEDEYGCTGTDEVVFESQCEDAIVMPNAFTPNGDGLNDIFKPVFLDQVSGYDLKIFNRWGKMIFETTDIGQGWNGKENNVPSVIEEYVYTIRYINDFGEEKLVKGSVTLLR